MIQKNVFKDKILIEKLIKGLKKVNKNQECSENNTYTIN